jgi:hypothetical protein
MLHADVEFSHGFDWDRSTQNVAVGIDVEVGDANLLWATHGKDLPTPTMQILGRFWRNHWKNDLQYKLKKHQNPVRK